MQNVTNLLTFQTIATDATWHRSDDFLFVFIIITGSRQRVVYHILGFLDFLQRPTKTRDFRFFAFLSSTPPPVLFSLFSLAPSNHLLHKFVLLLYHKHKKKWFVPIDSPSRRRPALDDAVSFTFEFVRTRLPRGSRLSFRARDFPFSCF